ncbi:hypothetical protein EVAR_43882_1 [Eumeta japonica]|uniref:Uncharacterized protein n=1 Tax=Eumeta variegata TaxID=151549 RepID=A0A4C1WN28_EUMVA|nr:hypothetical protein EVAR_43882_1 [Eumeta japonica]
MRAASVRGHPRMHRDVRRAIWTRDRPRCNVAAPNAKLSTRFALCSGFASFSLFFFWHRIAYEQKSRPFNPPRASASPPGGHVLAAPAPPPPGPSPRRFHAHQRKHTPDSLNTPGTRRRDTATAITPKSNGTSTASSGVDLETTQSISSHEPRQ